MRSLRQGTASALPAQTDHSSPPRASKVHGRLRSSDSNVQLIRAKWFFAKGVAGERIGVGAGAAANVAELADTAPTLQLRSIPQRDKERGMLVTQTL